MRQPQAGARGVAAGRRCRSRLRQAAWEKGVDLPPAPHLSGKTAAQHPRGVHVGPPTPPAQRRVCARRWHGCARRQRRRDPAATKTRHTGCVCGRVRSPPSVAAGEGDTHGCRELQPNQNKRPRREQRAARSTSECAATRFPTKTRPHRHRQRHWPTYLSVAAATGKEEATQVATGGAGGLPTRLEIGGQEQPKEARGRAHRQAPDGARPEPRKRRRKRTELTPLRCPRPSRCASQWPITGCPSCRPVGSGDGVSACWACAAGGWWGQSRWPAAVPGATVLQRGLGWVAAVPDRLEGANRGRTSCSLTRFVPRL